MRSTESNTPILVRQRRKRLNDPAARPPDTPLFEYLGRHEMPGTVGADLINLVLRDASSMTQASPRDWEGHIRWVNQLDDDYFSARMRECLARGFYKAQGF